ncbi:MAG: hypothetical protein K2Q12_01100 [Rickettsiales bacterium]|nr:hypothetical protein [Rickettsiales bacterium]
MSDDFFKSLVAAGAVSAAKKNLAQPRQFFMGDFTVQDTRSWVMNFMRIILSNEDLFAAWEHLRTSEHSLFKLISVLLDSAETDARITEGTLIQNLPDARRTRPILRQGWNLLERTMEEETAPENVKALALAIKGSLLDQISARQQAQQQL